MSSRIFRIIDNLSRQLTKKYGSGFSSTSLKYFRTFYLTYQDRCVEIGHPVGDQSKDSSIGRPMGAESVSVFSLRS